MAKYRCPSCGAAHREPVAACRLCGQRMGSDVELPHAAPPDDTMAIERYRAQSVIPYILGGLALVIVVAIAAVAFDVVATDDLGETANELPIIGPEDGAWSTYEDPDGRYTVDLPIEDPAVSQVEVLGADATITEAAIGDIMDLAVVWVDSPTITGDSTVGRLRPLAEQYAATFDAELDGEPAAGEFEGYPAIDVTTSGFNYNGAPGHQQMRLVEVDGDLVILVVTSVEENPEQYDRMVDSFSFGATEEAGEAP